ncbi:Hypothetical protein HVR_LOCUS754 [uncultured virus]|nr:Hypothetical protein HVR_LOCUS754 [uncultured virus]
MFRRLLSTSKIPSASSPPSPSKESQDPLYRTHADELHSLISKGNYMQIMKMLAEYPDLVNKARGTDKSTALHAACNSFRPVDPNHNPDHEAEMLRIVKLLISAKADMNARDKFMRSPLLLAIMHSRNLQLIRLLIFEGARIDFVDDQGNTVLHLAVSVQLNCLEITRFLLVDNQLGSMKLSKNTEGKTPFDIIDAKHEARDRVAVMTLLNPHYSVPTESDLIIPADYEVYIDQK